MSAPLASEILLRAGASTLLRYGTVARRMKPADQGGEQLQEIFSRPDGGTPLATLIDRSGFIRVAAQNKLRLSYLDRDGDGIFETAVLPLEPARSQAFTFAMQLDNVAWSRTAISVTANATAAPDGLIAGDKLVEDGTSGGHNLVRNCPALTDNTLQSWSFFAKAAERSWVHLRTADKAGGVQRSYFNLSTGAWGTRDAGHSLRAWKLANGWYRLACSFNSQSGATQPSVAVALSSADNTPVYQGDGTSGLYAWGLQFEKDQVFPSSFIYSDSALSRATDVFQLRAAFGPLASGLSVRMAFIEAGNQLLGVGQPRVWWLGKTDLSAPFFGLQNNAGYSVRWNPGSGLVSSLIASQAPSPGDLVDGCDTLVGQTIQRQQTVNGGAMAASSPATATGAIPSAFSDQLLSIELTGAGVELVDLAVAAAPHSLAEMQLIP